MTWMPQRGRLDRGRDAAYSRPSMTMRPPGSGRCTPEMILIRVDLPEPFSPTRQCTSPASQRQVDVAQRVHAAEALGDGVQVEEIRQAVSCVSQ